MADAISAINLMNVQAQNAYYVATTTQLYSSLSELTLYRLQEYGIRTEEIKSEDEAQALIEKKEAEKAEKVKAQQNGETYYDKQIMSDLIHLAEDIGVYVGTSTDIFTLVDNVKARLTHLQNIVGDNKNLKSIVDEYSNRYDYIYAQYMDKKATLQNQIITSLDAMSISFVSINTSV
ncbi:MAG: hypothetical protein K6C94_04595 [Candidatus Gastranaerophilales bacterium]|nr:hypothetical protein [Candidatus Gastranaerophilales bacterium]